MTDALLDALGPAADRIALLAPNGAAVAAAAHARWGSRIDIVDAAPDGSVSARESEAAVATLKALADAGVPAEAMRRIGSVEALEPAGLVLNLDGFGDRWTARGLAGLLDRVLAPGGRLLTDVRGGSGAFPVLRGRGTLETLSDREHEGRRVVRVLLTAPETAAVTAAPAADGGAAAEPWPVLARRLAGPEGFFREGDEHAFLYVPRGRTLVVTFDNLDIAMQKRTDRRPWGFAFIEKQGWSMLGVTAEGWTWFRDPWVLEQFAALRAGGFFARFDRVVFYGASMGGYAAAAFVAFCPGADAVAISPQSTLDRALVPWETRYRTAWGRDFAGPCGDAAEASRAGGRVILLYDPYEPLDAAHVARFTGANVVKLRTPLLGHRLGSSLQQMGILSPIILAALDGTLTEAGFYRTLRARKTSARYQRELFSKALAKGHAVLARKLGRWVLTRGDNRYIRKALAAM
jgi:hypothetical protein